MCCPRAHLPTSVRYAIGVQRCLRHGLTDSWCGEECAARFDRAGSAQVETPITSAITQSILPDGDHGECSTGQNCIPNYTTGALPDHRWVCRFIYPRMCRMHSGFPPGYPTAALYPSPYCSAPPAPSRRVPTPSEAMVLVRVVLHCI